MRFYFLLAFLLAGLCSGRAATTGQRTVRFVDTLTQLLAQPTVGLAEQVTIIKSVSALEDQDGFALFFRPLVTTEADGATVFAPANGSVGRWFKILGLGGGGPVGSGAIIDVAVVNVEGDSNYLTFSLEGTTLTLTNLYFNGGSGGGVTNVSAGSTNAGFFGLSAGITGGLLSLELLYATNSVQCDGSQIYTGTDVPGTEGALTNLHGKAAIPEAALPWTNTLNFYVTGQTVLSNTFFYATARIAGGYQVENLSTVSNFPYVLTVQQTTTVYDPDDNVITNVVASTTVTNTLPIYDGTPDYGGSSGITYLNQLAENSVTNVIPINLITNNPAAIKVIATSQSIVTPTGGHANFANRLLPKGSAKIENHQYYVFGSNPPPALYSISGVVFHDMNGDGLRQGYEPPFGGVLVNLADYITGANIAGLVVTSCPVNGTFVFTNMNTDNGYLLSIDAIEGIDNLPDFRVITPGSDFPNQDFGLVVHNPTTPTLSILIDDDLGVDDGVMNFPVDNVLNYTADTTDGQRIQFKSDYESVPVAFSVTVTDTNAATQIISLQTSASDLTVYPGQLIKGQWYTAIQAVIYESFGTETFIVEAPSPRTGLTTVVAISVGFDGAGTELVDDTKLDIEIPFACTITGVTLLADQSGSIVIDIWKDTYANYPPVAGDKITASAPPTISGALKSTDTTLTGWTTSIAAGDTLRFNITSATTITRCTLSLTAVRVP